MWKDAISLNSSFTNVSEIIAEEPTTDFEEPKSNFAQNYSDLDQLKNLKDLMKFLSAYHKPA